MKTIDVRQMTVDEIKGLGLSIYTLSRWAKTIELVYPWAIAALWAKGYCKEWGGVLTLDDLGNFMSFE